MIIGSVYSIFVAIFILKQILIMKHTVYIITFSVLIVCIVRSVVYLPFHFARMYRLQQNIPMTQTFCLTHIVLDDLTIISLSLLNGFLAWNSFLTLWSRELNSIKTSTIKIEIVFSLLVAIVYATLHGVDAKSCIDYKLCLNSLSDSFILKKNPEDHEQQIRVQFYAMGIEDDEKHETNVGLVESKIDIDLWCDFITILTILITSALSFCFYALAFKQKIQITNSDSYRIVRNSILKNRRQINNEQYVENFKHDKSIQNEHKTEKSVAVVPTYIIPQHINPSVNTARSSSVRHCPEKETKQIQYQPSLTSLSTTKFMKNKILPNSNETNQIGVVLLKNDHNYLEASSLLSTTHDHVKQHNMNRLRDQLMCPLKYINNQPFYFKESNIQHQSPPPIRSGTMNNTRRSYKKYLQLCNIFQTNFVISIGFLLCVSPFSMYILDVYQRRLIDLNSCAILKALSYFLALWIPITITVCDLTIRQNMQRWFIKDF
ncbi:unnamed protein product [Didymodactylos carnosus]|uniref:Uncharacterized protein n=1 Tax=Didymodactylos carnosus TaxID=1234261 RepID=A0A815Q3L0_9BILA|nr:unnamed protein product [Didymodactylos carnosus]CAF4329443.1 unnamed protein product [Didymodactylos carnosus]